jgi:signal peptidase I
VAVVVEIAAAFALILGLVSAVLRSRCLVITVRGESMLPTYVDGERLVVRKASTFRPGDVVVFAMPKDLQVDGMKWLIKRVTAVAGERVPSDVRHLVAEEYVPSGYLVVHGDGDRSLDSRQLGYIATADGLGIVSRRM